MSRANLRLVDTDTGEIAAACKDCAPMVDELEAQVSGLEKECRAWRTRYHNLARDKEAEARADSMWPQALELFDQWRALLSHKGCGWDADRFALVRPFLKKDGIAMCRRALAGAWFDAWAPERRNGSRKRLDEWERIFKDRKNFEEFVNRAPKDWELIFESDKSIKHHAGQPFADRKPVKVTA